MADRNNTDPATPWDDFLSDFTLILDSGESLRCHKWQLAKSSPFLKAKIQLAMEGPKADEMRITGHGLETVTSVLRYVYADEGSFLPSHGGHDLKEHDPETTVAYRREYAIDGLGEENLSPQVMRLANKWEIKALVEMCEDHLKENKPDKDTPWTARDIHELAIDIGNEKLEKCSSMWIAAGAFQDFRCGSCKGRTTKPPVLLKCKECEYLTIVSDIVPRIGQQKDGSKPDRFTSSEVAIKLE